MASDFYLCITDYVYFYLLGEVVSAKLLYCKVPPFPLEINNYFVGSYFKTIWISWCSSNFQFSHEFIYIWVDFQFYSMGFNRLLSLFLCSSCPKFGQKEAIHGGFCFLLTCPQHPSSTSLLSGTICPISYFPCLTAGIIHFFKEPWFLCLENSI